MAETAPTAPNARHRRPTATVAATMVLAAVVIAAAVATRPAWWQRFVRRPSDDTFARLVAAVGRERHVEAHFGGGFEYGPLPAVTRGPDSLATQNLQLVAVAADLQEAARREPTAERLRPWGVAQSLLGDHDGAVRTLEAAAVLRGDDAALLNDLAAALLERAGASGRSDDLPRALTVTERALLAAPASVDAAFNQALALERLGILDQALERWRELSMGTATSSAAEARTHVDAIERLGRPPGRITDGDAATDMVCHARALGDIRDWLRGVEIARWAAAVEAGDDASADATFGRYQEIARRLGNQDRFELAWSMTVAEAGRTRQRIEARRAGMLPAAMRWAQARDRTHLRELEAWWRDTWPHHPLAPWAGYFLADTLRATGRSQDARTLVREVQRLATARGYTTLAGHSAWLAGQILSVQARHVEAQASFERSLDHFNLVGNSVWRARLLSQLSSMHHLLGDDVSGWGRRAAAMSLAFGCRRDDVVDIVANGAASVALDRGMPAVALRFLQAQLRAATRSGDATGQAQASLRIARALLALGRSNEANQSLHTASATMAAMPSGPEKRALESLERQVTADALLVEMRLADAAAVAGAAIEAGPRNDVDRAWFELVRARASAAAGDIASAHRELETVLRLTGALHRGAAGIGVPAETRRELTELTGVVASALMSQGRGAEGAALFATHNASVAMWRPDDTAGPAALRSDLPPGAAVLGLHSTDSHLVAWLSVAGTFTHKRLPVTAATLRTLIDVTQVSAEQRSRPVFERSIDELSSYLLWPFAEQLPHVRTLVVLTSGALSGVPYAALRVGPGGSRLLERVDVQISSALTSRAPRRPRRSARTLVVVDPGSQAAGWPTLRGVARELDSLREAGIEGRVLAFGDVDARAVLSALAEMPDILHYAGHASTDHSRPADGGLVLTGGRAAPAARLTIGDLLTAGLVPPRIVLLSACATAKTLGDQREATGGLAGVFLALGSDAAIGALWNLDDAVGAEVFPAVHQYLRQGVSPAAAVRAAQRDYLGGHGAEHFDRVAGIAVYSPHFY